jgi:trehalose 6-phosphate synthase/phosphatase
MVAAHSRIVLASNRLPVTIVSGTDGPTLSASDDGLGPALRALHAHSDSRWVGHLGGAAKLDAAAARKLRGEARASRLRPVALRESAVALAYDGYANAVLWPLYHYLLDKVRLDASDEWRAYVEVNERFADAIAATLEPDDAVWIHDYQLALVPALLRQRVPSARIGFFQHIPWPSSDVFRILPARKQIVTGMLGADLIGFQTDNDRQHFLRSASDVLGVEPGAHGLSWPDREVTVGVYPIGVDVAGFAQRSLEIDATVALLRANTAGKITVLGVDPLDYTQGVPQRLLAIDRLLEREPALRERLHFIQIAVPTRENIDASTELQRTVNELVARINSQHGTATCSPVQLLYRNIPFEQQVALYRAADVMLVTPLRDGMNLVAKEYVAARTDTRGCLVLSEFAGAASELASALRVNPYDVSALATTIRSAMFMPVAEQTQRMRELRRVVTQQPVQRWARDFMHDLDIAYAREHQDTVYAQQPSHRSGVYAALCTKCKGVAHPRRACSH